MKISAFLLSVLAVAVCGRAETILVDEQFTDNERVTNTPPNSLQWTSGAHHGTAASAFTSLDPSGGNLVWDHTQSTNVNSFSGIWGHFTAGGSPISLNVGESLQLTFDVSFAGGAFSASLNGFRWGLFNSNNSRVTTDFAGANATGLSSGTVFASWKGYTGQTTINNAAIGGNNLLARERTGSSNALYASADYVDVAGTPVDEPLFSQSTTYAGSLVVTRTAAGVDVRAGIAGVFTNLGSDATPITQFDTVSFFVIDGVSHNVTMDNIRVSVIPEAGSLVLLGAFALQALLMRRRR